MRCGKPNQKNKRYRTAPDPTMRAGASLPTVPHFHTPNPQVPCPSSHAAFMRGIRAAISLHPVALFSIPPSLPSPTPRLFLTRLPPAAGPAQHHARPAQTPRTPLPPPGFTATGYHRLLALLNSNINIIYYPVCIHDTTRPTPRLFLTRLPPAAGPAQHHARPAQTPRTPLPPPGFTATGYHRLLALLNSNINIIYYPVCIHDTTRPTPRLFLTRLPPAAGPAQHHARPVQTPRTPSPTPRLHGNRLPPSAGLLNSKIYIIDHPVCIHPPYLQAFPPPATTVCCPFSTPTATSTTRRSSWCWCSRPRASLTTRQRAAGQQQGRTAAAAGQQRSSRGRSPTPASRRKTKGKWAGRGARGIHAA